MDQKIHYNQPILPVGASGAIPKERQNTQIGVSFQQVLQKELQTVTFSQHAQQRLKMRNISLSTQELQQIQAAVEKAAQKGSKESLLIMNNLALVVNVPNKTVITAIDGNSMKDNVFTKIDSAVIL